MEFINLPIEKESKRFKNHLLVKENERIIFSGIFGIGKTFFIDKFFENNCDEFIEIKLNPVNYSVSQTEDIFELIKFDIAFQLLGKNPTYEKIKFDKTFSSLFYISENYKELVKNLAISLTKLDRRIEAIAEPLLNLGEKINKFQEEHEIDEKEEITKFLEFFKLKKGTPREEDSITDLINGLLETLKTNDAKKKTVLVIDDLDRIDPEHIFRILNVFSSHFDYYNFEGENKFGFDKIILICDIENIRGIFNHRYGIKTDFNGYIDKFYSLEVFNYDFTKIIIESLDKFYRSIKVDNKKLDDYFKINQDNYYTKELTFILSYLIQVNSISMRTLINFLKSDLELPNYTVKTVANRKIHSIQTPILTIIQIIEKLLGSRKNFLNAIGKVIERYPIIEVIPYNDYWDARIGNVIMLIDHQNTKLDFSKDIQHFSSNELNLQVDYEVNPTDGHYGAYGKALRYGKIGDVMVDNPSSFSFQLSGTYLPYFQLLQMAVEKLNFLDTEE
jgi:hypothetical protein